MNFDINERQYIGLNDSDVEAEWNCYLNGWEPNTCSMDMSNVAPFLLVENKAPILYLCLA